MNISIHVVGFYLLLCLKPKKVQHWFVISLSITEIIKNVVIELTTIPDVMDLSDETWLVIDEIHVYLAITYDYGITTLYYMTMYYITLDRLLRILLSMSYPLYWNIKKTKILLLSTWVFSVLVCTILSLIYKFCGADNGLSYFIYVDDTEAAIVAYSHPCIDTIFLLLAIATYWTIFCKYALSRRRISISSNNRNVESSFQIFIRSPFFVPVLLILSFIIFTVFPNLIFAYYEFSGEEISYTLDVICYILFATSDLCDAFIYIFVQKQVRNTLLKKICCHSSCCKQNRVIYAEPSTRFPARCRTTEQAEVCVITSRV